jgi:cyanophycinase
VLIVPTAAAFENPSKAARNGVSHFGRLGAKAEALMVLKKADANDESMVGRLGSAEVVYLTGGDPNHLLSVLEGSRLAEGLKGWMEEGGVLAGSSAGAMVMAEWMGLTRAGGPARGLGLATGVAVLPHHERAEPGRVARELMEVTPPGLTALGINGATGCVGEGGTWRVMGKGRVVCYREGRWREFKVGETLRLDI